MILVAHSETTGTKSNISRSRNMVTQWRDISEIPDIDVASQARADGIDGLLDRDGHFGNNRLGVFALKSAPVQASCLGYPNTTGLQSMDYWIGDRLLSPPQIQPYFTEQSIAQPRCLNCHAVPDGAPLPGPLPAMENRFITFGCFNNGAKISPRTVYFWAKLLQSVPDSRLLFKARKLPRRPRAIT